MLIGIFQLKRYNSGYYEAPANVLKRLKRVLISILARQAHQWLVSLWLGSFNERAQLPPAYK